VEPEECSPAWERLSRDEDSGGGGDGNGNGVAGDEEEEEEEGDEGDETRTSGIATSIHFFITI
jgi:hypothetical protein